jgi:hypothetical protein
MKRKIIEVDVLVLNSFLVSSLATSQFLAFVMFYLKCSAGFVMRGLRVANFDVEYLH